MKIINELLSSFLEQAIALSGDTPALVLSNLLSYRENFLIFLNKLPFPFKKALHSHRAPGRLKFYQALRKLSRRSARPVLASDTRWHPFVCSNGMLFPKEWGGLGNPALVHLQCHETALNPKGLPVVTAACLHRTNCSNRAKKSSEGSQAGQKAAKGTVEDTRSTSLFPREMPLCMGFIFTCAFLSCD